MRRFCLSLFSAFLLVACGESGTGGEAISFSLGFASIPPEGQGPGRFTATTGWEIELEEASVAVGPLYLHTRAAPTASLFDRLKGLVIASAHAHSGFDNYDGGQVRGELLEPVVVDLLEGGVQQVRELRGVAGPVRSVSLELSSISRAPFAGGQAWMKGVARKDGEEVRFSGVLQLPDDPKLRRVTGLPASMELENGGEVVLEIHPIHWFGRLDFSALPVPAADGFRPIETDSDAHRAWARGVGAFGAFSIR